MLLLLLCLLPLSVLPLSYIGVGATGPVGRRFIDLVGGKKSNDVLVLGRNGFLASAPGRVSHDYGYLGPKLMKKTGAKIRDWDGGDILDITGDTWIGWQDDVANFKGDVAISFTGCLYDARVMAVDRLVTAFSGMGEGSGRPKRFICVTPLEEIVNSPKGKENVAAAAEAAAKLTDAGVSVINVKMGRVLGLKTDSIEATMYGHMYKMVGGGLIGRAEGSGGDVPWVHVDDAVRAIASVAASPTFADGAAGAAATVILDASKPLTAEAKEAGVSYEITDLKQALS